jgi:hypothetical protein
MHVSLLVGGDLGPQRLGHSFHLLGVDADAGQFPEQFLALLEADHRADQARHPHDGGRQRRADDPQRPIARGKAALTPGAMVVGARKGHLAQRRGDRFGVAAGIPGRCTTPTRKLRADVVGFVGVEALLQCATGDP